MVTELHIKEVPQKQLGINPKKFILWLFMVSIVMVFAALTSGFIVRQAEGNWIIYELPSQLWISTVILVVSSLTAHWALKSAQKSNSLQTKLGLWVTFGLGLVFLSTQVWVWEILVQHDVYLVGNPGGSFLYVLMGVHAFHLISGLIYLMIMLVKSYRANEVSEIQFQLSLSTTYWHFLGGLWIYLYVFLIIYH
ncbi:MAG: cytochrome c oxidase subunit 3 [Cyclobacteriaceae bacterium]|nr:cytochrome c oxidase subunit 3 [Cyclobacteriaceae bacterium]